MKALIQTAIAAAIALALLGTSLADAKTSKCGSGSRSVAHASGSGAKSQSTTVRGYTTKKGKHVARHHRTTPDSSKRNNYSSKGNVNPHTGKPGKK